MTRRPLSRAEVRSIDEAAAAEFALPTLALMENAGRGAAAALLGRLGPGGRVVILCGPGNNGGDGGVVARHLDASGADVHLAWLADPARLRGDAAAQHAILARSGVAMTTVADPLAELPPLWADAGWVVDALLGTGLARPVEGPIRAAIEALNRSGRRVMALDLPSGLDADTGRPLGAAVRAEVTATFVAPKLGFLTPGADEYTGVVEVIDIGVPRRLLDRLGIGPDLGDGPSR